MNTITVCISIQRRIRRRVYPAYPRVTSNPGVRSMPMMTTRLIAPAERCRDGLAWAGCRSAGRIWESNCLTANGRQFGIWSPIVIKRCLSAGWRNERFAPALGRVTAIVNGEGDGYHQKRSLPSLGAMRVCGCWEACERKGRLVKYNHLLGRRARCNRRELTLGEDSIEGGETPAPGSSKMLPRPLP
jgi:hypothetical protein